MRHTVIAILTSLFITIAASATETAVSDTIAVIENAGNITIRNTPDSTSVSVIDQNGDRIYHYQFSSDNNTDTDDGWNLNLPFLKEKNKRKDFEFSICVNPYVGASIVSDKPAGLHGSVEAGFWQLFCASYAPGAHGFSINIGAGFGNRLYTLGAGNRFAFNQRRLTTEKADKAMSGIKNRLSMTSFHMPVMLRQRIGKHFGVSAGAWLNFNTYSTANVSYDLDGIHYKESYKGLHQRLMTVDFVGIIGFPDEVALYARYSPMRPFDNGYGPQFKTLSLGITLGF